MSIVTLTDAKARLGITGTSDDVEIQAFIDALTVPVEYYRREVIEQRAITEDLDLGYAPQVRFWLTRTPVISLTTLTSLDGSITYDVTKYKAEPSGLVRAITGPYPFPSAPYLIGTVTVTYQAGYASVPANIREGALVILQHLWETQRGAGGIGSGVVGPEEIRRALSTFTIPNKAREWLGDSTSLIG